MGLMNIRQVSCGENHTLALVDMMPQIEDEEEEDSKEDQGPATKLFVWGNNDKR